MEENRKTKYRIKAWIQKHMIAVWAICSILFAIIIHLLFHWETDIKILHAKWEAGDILTYVSTVALGLLAVWQNKRFKEENDVAQERLERLTAQANEISLINKIVEIESDHLSRLRKALDEFTDACKPATLVNIYLSDDKSKTVADEFETAKNSVDVGGVIDNCYRAVLRELPMSVLSNKSFLESFKAFHEAAGAFLERVTKDPFPEDKYVENLRNEYKNFDIQKEDMLERETQKLNRVIYGHFIVRSPKTGKEFDVPAGKHWVYSQQNLESLVNDNQIWFGEDGNAFPRKKRFLTDVQDGRTPSTLWLAEEVGHNQSATREVKALFEDWIHNVQSVIHSNVAATQSEVLESPDVKWNDYQRIIEIVDFSNSDGMFSCKFKILRNLTSDPEKIHVFNNETVAASFMV